MSAPGVWAGLKEAADRLAALGAVHHPLALRRRAGERVVAAVQGGASADQALRAAGIPGPVAELVRAAAPAELPAVLLDLAGAYGRAEVRRRELASLALYPLTLAATALALGAVAMLGVRPAMAWVSAAEADLPVLAPYPMATMAVLGASCAALLFLALALRVSRPIWPFAEARRVRDRALLCSAAASLAGHGTGLPAALRAAAGLVASPALRDAAGELAAALDRGEDSRAGTELFGATGAGFFASAAAQGAGPSALAALADLHEAAAETALPGEVLKAEMLALLAGGAAVAAAAAAFMGIYAGTFGGIPWVG